MEEKNHWFKDYFKEKIRIFKRNRQDKKDYKKQIKKREKMLKEIDAEVKQMEKEERKERKKIPFGKRMVNYVVDFYKDVTDTQDEKELLKLMNEREKAELKEREKYNKITTISIAGSLTIFAVVAIVVLVVFREATKTDFERYVIPYIDNYYDTNFNTRDKYEDIKYLSYYDNDRNEIKTDVVLATFPDNVHVMSVKDTQVGDDVHTEKVYEDYKNKMLSLMGNVGTFFTDTKITYNPYILDYNYYFDYIDCLPSGKSFDELYNDGNLTIIDKVSYQGELNLDSINHFMEKLGDDSRFYFIETNGVTVFSLTVVEKTGYKKYPITSAIPIAPYGTFYEFNHDVGAIGGVEIEIVDDNYSEDYDYIYRNNLDIKPVMEKTSYMRDREKDKDLSKLFMIKLGEELSTDDYVFLDNNGKELELEYYPDVQIFHTATGTYVIGEKSFIIGKKVKANAPWYCKYFGCKI